MKAAVRSKYGSSDVLRIEEIEKPVPGDNEVLIKVFATTVNRTDCHILRGAPFVMRFFTGLFKPRIAITGTDYAGQIEAIGTDVKSFKVGDKVMGFGFWGVKSHAQYLTLPETMEMVIIPNNITYEQAAACIEGAFYALGVIQRVSPKPGQKALVYGATGAIGTSYVQFFTLYETSVTAVCNSDQTELVKSLGANKVIDYKRDDFTKDEEKYDFVFDAVGKSTFGKCKSLLKKNGSYASSSGFENLFLAFITPVIGGKKVVFAAPKNLRASLNFIKDLVEKGKFKPVIDKLFPLNRISEAFTYVATGEKIGNVIITMHPYQVE